MVAPTLTLESRCGILVGLWVVDTDVVLRLVHHYCQTIPHDVCGDVYSPRDVDTIKSMMGNTDSEPGDMIVR